MADKIIHNIDDDRKHWKTLKPQKNLLLGSHHLNEGEVLEVTIKQAYMGAYKDRQGNDCEDLMISFEELSQPMIVNMGNGETVEMLYGGDIDEWSGKRIQIYAQDGIHKPGGKKGETTTALRIKNFKPSSEDEAKKHIAAINKCKSMSELKRVFLSVPKHLQKQCEPAKDKMKDKFE